MFAVWVFVVVSGVCLFGWFGLLFLGGGCGILHLLASLVFVGWRVCCCLLG